MINNPDTNLFWVDLEMTGLDPEKDVILEIACLITDSDLNILAEGPEIAIHQDDSELAKINEQVNEIFKQSDLREKVKNSKINLAEAEDQVLNFVTKYCIKGRSPYCGNTVATDKQFIKKYMPKLYDYLHYRTIDVSTVKELAKRWYPKLPIYIKAEKHRAMDDIKESVAEMKYYRDKVFVKEITA
jgi:oligoribonuclease